MADITFNEIAHQQFRRFVDYMCLLTKHRPSCYELFINDNSQIIQYRDGDKIVRLIHDIRLKNFVGKLITTNDVLELAVKSQV